MKSQLVILSFYLFFCLKSILVPQISFSHKAFLLEENWVQIISMLFWNASKNVVKAQIMEHFFENDERILVVKYSYKKSHHNGIHNICWRIKPFVPNAPFLYPLKTSENNKLFWCFQRLKEGCIGNKWVKR